MKHKKEDSYDACVDIFYNGVLNDGVYATVATAARVSMTNALNYYAALHDYHEDDPVQSIVQRVLSSYNLDADALEGAMKDFVMLGMLDTALSFDTNKFYNKNSIIKHYIVALVDELCEELGYKREQLGEVWKDIHGTLFSGPDSMMKATGILRRLYMNNIDDEDAEDISDLFLPLQLMQLFVSCMEVQSVTPMYFLEALNSIELCVNSDGQVARGLRAEGWSDEDIAEYFRRENAAAVEYKN